MPRGENKTDEKSDSVAILESERKRRRDTTRKKAASPFLRYFTACLRTRALAPTRFFAACFVKIEIQE